MYGMQGVKARIGLAVPGRPIGPVRSRTLWRSGPPRPGTDRPVHGGYRRSRQVEECNGHERSPKELRTAGQIASEAATRPLLRRRARVRVSPPPPTGPGHCRGPLPCPRAATRTSEDAGALSISGLAQVWRRSWTRSTAGGRGRSHASEDRGARRRPRRWSCLPGGGPVPAGGRGAEFVGPANRLEGASHAATTCLPGAVLGGLPRPGPRPGCTTFFRIFVAIPILIVLGTRRGGDLAVDSTSTATSGRGRARAGCCSSGRC